MDDFNEAQQFSGIPPKSNESGVSNQSAKDSNDLNQEPQRSVEAHEFNKDTSPKVVFEWTCTEKDKQDIGFVDIERYAAFLHEFGMDADAIKGFGVHFIRLPGSLGLNERGYSTPESVNINLRYFFEHRENALRVIEDILKNRDKYGFWKIRSVRDEIGAIVTNPNDLRALFEYLKNSNDYAEAINYCRKMLDESTEREINKNLFHETRHSLDAKRWFARNDIVYNLSTLLLGNLGPHEQLAIKFADKALKDPRYRRIIQLSNSNLPPSI